MSLWQKIFGSKSASKPDDTVCIVTCELPGEFARGRTRSQLQPIVAKCAEFAGNLVVARYDIDPQHREVICVADPSRPGVIYKWHVPPEHATEVVEYTKQAWRELMSDVRRVGIQALLNA